jgi:hypothetical protein
LDVASGAAFVFAYRLLWADRNPTSWHFLLDGAVVKLLAEYLERAAELEQRATEAEDAKNKHRLLIQATDYRRLAAKRAHELKLANPVDPPQTN